MIYPYRCVMCGDEVEIYKSARLAAMEEVCSNCGIVLERIWVVPQTIIANHDYYNAGLGIRVKNGHSVKDELKRIKDTTGREVVEVGNEKVKTKRVYNDYKMSEKDMAGISAVLDK